MGSAQPQIDNLETLAKANTLLMSGTSQLSASDEEDQWPSAQPRPSLNSSYEREEVVSNSGASTRSNEQQDNATIKPLNGSPITDSEETSPLTTFFWNCEPLQGKNVQITGLISNENSFEGQYLYLLHKNYGASSIFMTFYNTLLFILMLYDAL